MAVKLILVVLLVAVVASGLAQQSSDRQRTGGEDNTRTDRRLNALRRFRSRNRSNKETENQEKESGRGSVPRSRLADQDKIAERRRELLQRNGVSRRRKVVRNEVNEIPEEQTKKPVQNIRIRTTTEQSREIEEIPVERITNNNQEIINAALDYEEEEKSPFSGVSEVRTLNKPSGFRSSNEQIVRINFKKTTAAPEEDSAPTQAPRRRFQPNRNIVRKGLLGRRPATQAPATRQIETTTKVLLLSQASDALKALLQTANADETVENPDAQINAVEEDLSEDAEAALLEMEEDNGHIKATPRPRGRGRGDRRRVRVNIRGRGQQRPRTEDSEATEAPRQSTGSRRDRFRSFPARQGGSRANAGGRPSGSRSRIVTPRTETTQRVEAVEGFAPATEASRFEARPTVAAPVVNTPVRIPDFKVFDDFEGFTFPTPIRAPPTAAAPALQAEVPRSQASPVPVPGQSQFTLQQNFVAAQPQPVQQQPQPVQQQPQPVQRPQTPLRPASLSQAVPQQPARQQTVFAQQPQQPQQPQRVQPFVAFNNQQFQSVSPQQPQAAPAANRFQPQAAPQQPQQPQQAGSFNLLNPSNFQAFDAQFGGSVPSNNAQAVSASNIFAQPQSALLQGRDVLVNPFSGQQPSVFGQQQQNLFGQPATSNNFQAFRSG